MLAGERDDVAATIDAALNYALTAWAQAPCGDLGRAATLEAAVPACLPNTAGFRTKFGAGGTGGS